MSSPSSIKPHTVHNREARVCLHCKKYFVPRKSLPIYVEGQTNQVWCSKKCYSILYPPVKEIRECRICLIEYTPKRKDSTNCGKPECKKEAYLKAQRKAHRVRRDDMTHEQREAERKANRERNRVRRDDMTHEQKEAYLKADRERRANFTPEEKEAQNKYHRERLADMTPEQKEARRKLNREWYENMTPEQKEARNKVYRERLVNMTPEQREARNKAQREWYHENKEKPSL